MRIGCQGSKDVNQCIDDVEESLKYALIECRGGDGCIEKANDTREAKEKECIALNDLTEFIECMEEAEADWQEDAAICKCRDAAE